MSRRSISCFFVNCVYRVKQIYYIFLVIGLLWRTSVLFLFKKAKSATMNIFRIFLFAFQIICKSRIKLCFHNKSVHYS